MKFVIAPDKFKGSITSFEFCELAEMVLLEHFPKAAILKLPLADGGDGTIEIVKHYLGGERIIAQVSDPLFRPISASYIWSESIQTAYIEMAEASGHHLLSTEELNCMETTSLGTGELILNALERGATTIYLGIGGSATNDGGLGMAQALGYQFLDAQNKPINPIGKNLFQVSSIDTSKCNLLLKKCMFKVACDVDNPFYGPNGAAFVYGPQKGATPENVAFLDQGLQHFSSVLKQTFGTDVQKLPGAGAAGGIGGGAHVFLDATLVSGVNLLKEMAQFDEKITDADWIITGEGQLDAQTLSGKTINGVLASALKQNIPVAAFCGAVRLSKEQQQKLGLTYINAILTEVVDLPTAMANGKENLQKALYNFCNVLKQYHSPG